ncbi:MAG TPA: hypothetical protein VJJ52_06020 [Candidatus Nanoarchaeia archaeon]|nr:hypothetical protein [Candidatus Nanoarchaeia archaeon]
MKKRGQLVNKALIVLITSAVVIITFYSAGKTYGNKEAYYRLAVAKDIALTIDYLYSIPGDVEFIYPNEVSDYDIEITDNSVRVYQHGSGKLDATAGIYGYAGTSYDKINTFVSGPKYIEIKKTGNTITAIGLQDKTI